MVLSLEFYFKGVIDGVAFELVLWDFVSLRDIVVHPTILGYSDFAHNFLGSWVIWIPSLGHIAIVVWALVCENAQLVLARWDPEVEVLLQLASQEVGIVHTMLPGSEISIEVRAALWGLIRLGLPTWEYIV